MEWTSEQLCRARCYGRRWWSFYGPLTPDVKKTLEEWRKKALDDFGGSENIKCQDCVLNMGCSPICLRFWDLRKWKAPRNPHIIPDEIYLKGYPCPHFVDRNGLDEKKIRSLQSKADEDDYDEE